MEYDTFTTQNGSNSTQNQNQISEQSNNNQQNHLEVNTQIVINVRSIFWWIKGILGEYH